MKNYCDACFLYHDLWIFSLEFDDITSTTDLVKIYFCFPLFFSIINYWRSVNKRVADQYSEFFPTFEHKCLR